MKKRIYRKFPYAIEFEQRYQYHSNLSYLVKIMAEMNGKFGMFPVSVNDNVIQAKREISVEIIGNGVDFEPLNNNTLPSIINTITTEGIVDFKINLIYSFLNEKYNRVPFKGDTFLVRASLEKSILLLQIHRINGFGRTEISRLADTIVEEIRRGF